VPLFFAHFYRAPRLPVVGTLSARALARLSVFRHFFISSWLVIDLVMSFGMPKTAIRTIQFSYLDMA
jgi:hypothetical protein